MTTCLFAPYATPFRSAHDARAAARRVNRDRRDKRRITVVRCPCCRSYYLAVLARDQRWARSRRRQQRHHQRRHAA